MTSLKTLKVKMEAIGMMSNSHEPTVRRAHRSRSSGRNSRRVATTSSAASTRNRPSRPGSRWWTSTRTATRRITTASLQLCNLKSVREWHRVLCLMSNKWANQRAWCSNILTRFLAVAIPLRWIKTAITTPRASK